MNLEHLFSQAVSDCEQFAELLAQEQEALEQHKMDDLEVLLQAKTPLIAKLNTHDAAIHGCASAMGKQPTQSMEDFVTSFDDNTLTEQYQAFKALLIRCQENNIRNARLVRHSQNANSHLMGLLRNQGETTQSVYDRQGLATSSGVQRTSIKV